MKLAAETLKLLTNTLNVINDTFKLGVHGPTGIPTARQTNMMIHKDAFVAIFDDIDNALFTFMEQLS